MEEYEPTTVRKLSRMRRRYSPVWVRDKQPPRLELLPKSHGTPGIEEEAVEVPDLDAPMPSQPLQGPGLDGPTLLPPLEGGVAPQLYDSAMPLEEPEGNSLDQGSTRTSPTAPEDAPDTNDLVNHRAQPEAPALSQQAPSLQDANQHHCEDSIHQEVVSSTSTTSEDPSPSPSNLRIRKYGAANVYEQLSSVLMHYPPRSIVPTRGDLFVNREIGGQSPPRAWIMQDRWLPIPDGHLRLGDDL